MTTVRPGLDAALRQVIAARTEELFRSSGALPRGPLPAQERAPRRRVRREVRGPPGPGRDQRAVRVLRGLGPRTRAATPMVDLVAGPTTGGIILAFETGRQLGTRAIFAEEVRADDGTLRREFRRGFRIEPGERVLLVDDILTTGGSLLAMIPAVEALGGEIIECVVLVDRSGGRSTLTSPRPAGRTRCARSGSSTCRPTSRVSDVSQVRRRDAAPRAGQHGHRCRGRRGEPAQPPEPADPARWIRGPATSSPWSSAPSSS